MSKSFMPWLSSQFVDSANNPVTNGTVTVYYYGTTSLAPVYNLAGVETTNPHGLDINGVADIKLDSNIGYDLVVKDYLGGCLLYTSDAADE